MTTLSHQRPLLILSGGGLPGIDIHAGVLLALERAGLYPPAEIHGTSAGAIAAAFIAAGHSARQIAAIVRNLSDRDIRQERLLWRIRLPWIDGFLKTGRIRRTLVKHLPDNHHAFTIPWHAWAVRATDNEPINVARPEITPDPIDAILASAAIPGVFPAIRLHDGHRYIDGGFRKNVPIPPPACLDAHPLTIIVIASTNPREYPKTRGAITAFLRTHTRLMGGQIADAILSVQGRPNTIVLWPIVHTRAGMLRLDHSLIDQAFAWSTSKLQYLKTQEKL